MIPQEILMIGSLYKNLHKEKNTDISMIYKFYMKYFSI